MDFHISGVEVILYKSGTISFIVLDSVSFNVSGPTENDTSVYKIRVDKNFPRKISASIFVTDGDITHLYHSETSLPEKIINDDFAMIFHE